MCVSTRVRTLTLSQPTSRWVAAYHSLLAPAFPVNSTCVPCHPCTVCQPGALSQFTQPAPYRWTSVVLLQTVAPQTGLWTQHLYFSSVSSGRFLGQQVKARVTCSRAPDNPVCSLRRSCSPPAEALFSPHSHRPSFLTGWQGSRHGWWLALLWRLWRGLTPRTNSTAYTLLDCSNKGLRPFLLTFHSEITVDSRSAVGHDTKRPHGPFPEFGATFLLTGTGITTGPCGAWAPHGTHRRALAKGLDWHLTGVYNYTLLRPGTRGHLSGHC